MRIHKLPAAALASLLGLAGCAQIPTGPTVAVTPAPYEPYPIFQQDQAACEQQAQSQVSNNLASWGQSTVPQNATLPLQQQYDLAYTQCMSAKGNQTPDEPAITVPPPPPLGSPPPPQ